MTNEWEKIIWDIKIPKEQAEIIRQIAKEQGVSTETLVKQWMRAHLEKLKAEVKQNVS